MQYWISDGTQQFGPYPAEELLDHGLQPQWLVWAEGMESWTRADAVSEIKPLFDRPAGSPQPAQSPQPTQPSQSPSPAPANPGLQPINYAGPAPQPVAPVGYHYQPAQPQTMAIVALVCGLAGFMVGFPASIVAIIFGHIALGRIRRGEETGHGMAVAGLILGYVIAGTSAIVILGFCAIPCFAGAIA